VYKTKTAQKTHINHNKMVLPKLNRFVALAFNSDAGQRNMLKAALESASHSHSHESNSKLFRFFTQSTIANTKIISFVGSLVLSGAVMLATINTFIVIFNYFTGFYQPGFLYLLL